MTGWLAVRWLWAAIRAALPRRARGHQQPQPDPAEVLAAARAAELKAMSFRFRPREPGAAGWPGEDLGGFGVPRRDPGREPGRAQWRRVPEGEQFDLLSWGPVLDPPWPLPSEVTGGQPVMCAAPPDDCPLGPDPHPFTPPTDETELCCCRQPWEDTRK